MTSGTLRRRQVSLRGVLIGVTGLCVGLAVASFLQQRWMRIERAVRLLKDHNAAITYRDHELFYALEDSPDQIVDYSHLNDYRGPGCLAELGSEPALGNEQSVELAWPGARSGSPSRTQSHLPSNTLPALLDAVADLQDLRSLGLHGELGDDDLARIAGLRRLKYLDLTSTRIAGRSLDQLESRGRITRLDLSWTHVGSDAPGTLDRLRRSFPRLEALAFDVTHVPRESACEFSGLSRLEMLALTGFGTHSVRVANLPRLSRLHVEELAFAVVELDDLPALEHLSFQATTTLGGRMLACDTARVKHLPKLTSLELRAGVMEIARLPSLQRLVVTDCVSLVALDLPALEELSLVSGGCAESDLAFVAACGRLRQCDVSGNAAITNKFATTLRSCHELRELRMAGCAIDDDCVDAIASLANLSVFDCRDAKLTAAGVEALSERRPELIVIRAQE